MTTSTTTPRLPARPVDFDLPPGREATLPPEARGLARDHVPLLVARPDALVHARFDDLPDHLDAGDLVVVNTTPTMAAALDVRLGGGSGGHVPGRLGGGPGGDVPGRPVVVHLSTRQDDGTWEVELRRPDGTGPVLDAEPTARVDLVDGGHLHLLGPAGAARGDGGVRLWRTRLGLPTDVATHLDTHGRAITYAHAPARLPLAARQTAFARLAPPAAWTDPVVDGASAEMASAGRPFTAALVTALVRRGVVVAPLSLHAGVSSLDHDEPPRPEPFAVPETTAALVNRTRGVGRRVIAVGTTVTRALETVGRPDGTVAAGRGWTDLVLGPDRPARVVDGLVTGWHPPAASHLLLLEAVAGRDLVRRAYDAALAGPYRWHEFGDSCLLLP